MPRWERTVNLYDRTYRRNLYNFIDAYGKDVAIYKVSTATCTSYPWDPINQESTNPNCTTCDGTGFIKTETVVHVKGFINKNQKKSFYREGNAVYGIEPDGDASITVKLDDVLDNIFISTSTPILTACEKIICEGTYYKPKDWERHGVSNLHILTITVERIREETQ